MEDERSGSTTPVPQPELLVVQNVPASDDDPDSKAELQLQCKIAVGKMMHLSLAAEKEKQMEIVGEQLENSDNNSNQSESSSLAPVKTPWQQKNLFATPIDGAGEKTNTETPNPPNPESPPGKKSISERMLALRIAAPACCPAEAERKVRLRQKLNRHLKKNN